MRAMFVQGAMRDLLPEGRRRRVRELLDLKARLARRYAPRSEMPNVAVFGRVNVHFSR